MEEDEYEFMFSLEFDLYPDEGIDLEAVKLFQERITGEYWSLSKSGEIIDIHFDNLLEISLVVNTRDPRTVWSLNLLPRFFAKELSRKEKSLWQIEVYHHEHKETDRVILIEDRVHLQEYHKFWMAHVHSFRNLIKDVGKIRIRG